MTEFEKLLDFSQPLDVNLLDQVPPSSASIPSVLRFFDNRTPTDADLHRKEFSLSFGQRGTCRIGPAVILSLVPSGECTRWSFQPESIQNVPKKLADFAQSGNLARTREPGTECQELRFHSV